MTISIDWSSRVISVPRADMTLVQSTPFEVRALSVDSFRLALRDLEDDVAGMALPHTHNHIAPITVGGVTLARVVEIVNGYTITLENGAYAVNVVGGNSNIGDRTNLNTVQVRSANSAGLVQIISGSGLSPSQDQRLSDIETRVNALPDAPAIADAVWGADITDYVVSGTMGERLAAEIAMVADLWQVEGLDPVNPMTVTRTSRVAGSVTLDLSGDWETTMTVERQ